MVRHKEASIKKSDKLSRYKLSRYKYQGVSNKIYLAHKADYVTVQLHTNIIAANGMLCHNFNGALSHRLGLLGPTVGTIFAADNKFVISFLIFYENKARFCIVDLHTDAKFVVSCLIF